MNNWYFRLLLLLLAVVGPATSYGQTLVGNNNELKAALQAFNSSSTDIDISITQSFTISEFMPIISNSSSNPELTIEGNGNTINGGGGFRLFLIGGASDVTIRNLTITNSKQTNGSAVGIFENAKVRLENINFIDNSTESGSGGAVGNSSNQLITIVSCTFQNNSAGSGGAIFGLGGILNIFNSTFVNNTATAVFGGGAIGQQRSIGSMSNSTLNIDNSTFFQNSAPNGAGGAIRTSGVNLDVSRSTLASNESDEDEGSNLFSGNGSFVTLQSSILSDGNCNLGVLSSLGLASQKNLSQATGVNACGMMNNVNDNLVGLDPLLSPPADNGGSTHTMASTCNQ